MSKIVTDNILYDQAFATGDRPIKYIINQFNVPPNQYFPVIGNARGLNVRSDFERPIPTYTGRKVIEGTVLPYATTPDYNLKSGDNPVDTTNGFLLKAGLTLRNKKSGNDTSSRGYEIFGDASVSPVIVQNAGQFRDPSMPLTRGVELGYNREITRYANGVGVIWPEGQQCGISSRNTMLNITNYGNK